MSSHNRRATKAELGLIQRIGKRGQDLATRSKIRYPWTAMLADVEACHCNGTRLDLQKLLKVPDPIFSHDILGIRRNIDRRTGKIGNHFRPRCAAKGGRGARL